MDEGPCLMGVAGAVAAHDNRGGWEVLPMLALVRQRKETGQPSLPLIGVSLDGVRERWADDGRPAASEDRSSYKVVYSGDIVMNALGKPHGSIGRSPTRGITSPAYWVLAPDTLAESRFLHHLLRSGHLINEYQRLGKNQPPNQFDLGWSQFRSIEVPVPPLEDQRRIADFLDDQVARIDNIIAARRSQIELIDSQRLCELDSLINADERPAARLALFAQIQSGITVDAGRESVDGIDIPYLRVANVQAGALNLDEVKSIRVARSQVSRYLLRDGDVLMTEGGDIDKLGRGTVWRSQVPGAIHQNHVFAVRVEQARVIPEYLAYVTAARPARHYFEVTGNRTTNLASTSATKVLDLRIPVRGVDDQACVVEAVEEADSRARAGTGLLLDSIARVEELKQSLITAAVTGQFDVSTADGSQVSR
jgi:type I restriction enzyme, S subunit